MFLKSALISILFFIFRQLIHLFGITGIESQQFASSIFPPLFICTIVLLSYIFKCLHTEWLEWSRCVIVLSNQIVKYIEVWEFLAVEDPQQLLAAIHQIQSLVDATLAAFLSRSDQHLTVAIDHATNTLDFLHLAHRNLIAEIGSTPPIMRLVRALQAIRAYISRIRTRPTLTIWKPISAITCGIVLMNLITLAILPPLSSLISELLGTSACIFCLIGCLSLVWALQTPFGPQLTIVQWLTESVGVSLEPLLYVRQRLATKEQQTKQQC
jgi:hypothetical protein